MTRTPVIAIFDVGKTNKKLVLFDQDYALVHEEETRLAETTDEDGFPCEDVLALTDWVKTSFNRIVHDEKYELKAVNFSAYGASFVHLDDDLNVVPPLYNYLKPYPESLQKEFNRAYDQTTIARQTASPVLGNLNSGMQLYRLKYEKPDVFEKIRFALHLPQCLSFVLSRSLYAEITSVGCHTALWDFQESNYHGWTMNEGLVGKFPQIIQGDQVAGHFDGRIAIGTGLHDSSAALIPYLLSFKEPFVLLSTGTWCITLNPFNHAPLTDEELRQDCLCYLSHKGTPVKASRLFAGHVHDQQTKRLSEYFQRPPEYYSTVAYDSSIAKRLTDVQREPPQPVTLDLSGFSLRDLSQFSSFEEAYHQLIIDLIRCQAISTNLVLKETEVRRLFVDGGFGKNPVYMHLLAWAFPDMEVYAATVPQASALGAALVLHPHWNDRPLPDHCIVLEHFDRTKS